MKNVLVVVDMQNDFIDGSLGTKEAVDIVPRVVKKIYDWDGPVIWTRDTHETNYLETREGRYLPIPHCIRGTEGYRIQKDVAQALLEVESGDNDDLSIKKISFASLTLPEQLKERYGDDITVTFCGLCTDICVLANVIVVKSCFPEADIYVDAACCAGTTPEKHKAALEVMKSCQVEVYNEEI